MYQCVHHEIHIFSNEDSPGAVRVGYEIVLFDKETLICRFPGRHLFSVAYYIWDYLQYTYFVGICSIFKYSICVVFVCFFVTFLTNCLNFLSWYFVKLFCSDYNSWMMCWWHRNVYREPGCFSDCLLSSYDHNFNIWFSNI